MRNKLLTLVLLFTVIMTTTSCQVSTAKIQDKPPIKVKIASKCAYVYNITDNKVVYKKNANSKTGIASLTKLLVELLAIENIKDLNTRAETLQCDYDYIKSVKEDSTNGFAVGEKATIQDYLNAMMMNSCADASMTVLRYLGDGNMNKGVSLMNKRAAQLGMKHSHFVDAIGDDKKSAYSTCADMGKLLTRAMKYKKFKTIFSRRSYIIKTNNKRENATIIKNQALLKSSKKSLIKGAKLGYTPQTKKSLASYAIIKGKTYICITTQAKTTLSNSYPNITDAEKIYNAIASQK